MEQEIIVKSVEHKISKKGQPFIALKTNNGNFSCWNAQIFNHFIEGKKYKVLTEVNNGYSNILGIEQELGLVPASEYKEQFKEAREEKGRLMEISYTKDIFLGLMQYSLAKNLEFDALATAQLSVECLKKIRSGINELQ